MLNDEAGNDIIEDWIIRSILGNENIRALERLGMIAKTPDGSGSPFEFEIKVHALTGPGRAAIRDHATVLALSDLHDLAGGMDELTRGEWSTKEYAPSRREFESLAELCRKMLIEVVALRGEMVTLKARTEEDS